MIHYLMFCPFLQKRGYCKKGSRCDFHHNSTYQSTINHQPHNTSPRRPVQLYHPFLRFNYHLFWEPTTKQYYGLSESVGNETTEYRTCPNILPPLFPPSTAATYVSALPVSISKSFNGNLSLSSTIPPLFMNNHNSSNPYQPTLTNTSLQASSNPFITELCQSTPFQNKIVLIFQK